MAHIAAGAKKVVISAPAGILISNIDLTSLSADFGPSVPSALPETTLLNTVRYALHSVSTNFTAPALTKPRWHLRLFSLTNLRFRASSGRSPNEIRRLAFCVKTSVKIP